MHGFVIYRPDLGKSVVLITGLAYKLERGKGGAINPAIFEKKLEVWQPEGCALRIAYSRALMQELRLASVDGFHRLAHGGIEIGGVLFGVRDPDGIQILAHRELACEYVFGPSFTLSENDCRALEALLVSPDRDSELSGMQAVGWYQSHTRSEILLSDEKLRFYQQYFPEMWQVALVLRPHRFDPVRAGFFFREPDGSVHATSSCLEFDIEPVPVEPAVRSPEERIPAETMGSPDPAVAGPAVGSPEEPTPAQTAPVPVPTPPAVSRGPRWRWDRIAALIAVTLAGALLWNVRPHARTDLSLRALDEGGQLRINWNHGSRLIQQSQSGAVEIEDGSYKLHNELSQEDLRVGSITYLRTTGHVKVSLMVRGADHGTQTEILRFSGSPVIVAATPPTSEPDQEVQPVEQTVERLANPALRVVRTANVNAPPVITPKAPARRPLVLPPAGIVRATEPLLPAPPPIESNTAPAIAALIPHVPGPALPRPSIANSARADQGPTAGKIIWTGKLSRSGTLQILGNHASQGHMIGGLPGGPVRVQVFPSEITQEGVRIFSADPHSIGVPEAPGAQNGWNRTVYVLDPKKAGEVTMLESPGQQNAWNRLILRAERGEHFIIVLRWERVSAEPAPAVAGNQ